MSSGMPPNYPWLQQLGTVLDDYSEPGINGFEPQLWFTGGLPKLSVIESNRQTSMARFKKITGSTMPVWWPFHANGMMVTHLYRLIDEYLANDLKFPKSSPAMSHNLQPEEPVDFTTKQNKQLSLQHVSRVSEGYYALRPFLSASCHWRTLSVLVIGKWCIQRRKVKSSDQSMSASILSRCGQTAGSQRLRSFSSTTKRSSINISEKMG